MNFTKENKSSKSREENKKKKDGLKSLYATAYGKERVLDAFDSKVLPIQIEGKEFF